MGIWMLLGGIVLLPFETKAKDMTCQMTKRTILCKLQQDGVIYTVNCQENGAPDSSFQCTKKDAEWNCEGKGDRKGANLHLSNDDFGDDVTRCTKLCDFCPYDWRPVLDQQKTDNQGKKCRKVEQCTEEADVRVLKNKKKCTKSRFSEQERCTDEPVYEMERKCINYKTVEVCE